jgi:hypothetical protein
MPETPPVEIPKPWKRFGSGKREGCLLREITNEKILRKF